MTMMANTQRQLGSTTSNWVAMIGPRPMPNSAKVLC